MKFCIIQIEEGEYGKMKYSKDCNCKKWKMLQKKVKGTFLFCKVHATWSVSNAMKLLCCD